MREIGILMHISSLPSEYGIGSLGKPAFDFIDFLNKSGVNRWQVLPIGPTGYGNSPYQPTSTFAGNPYFIDLEILNKSNLLTSDELKSARYSCSTVDYSRLYVTRLDLLRHAFNRFEPDDEYDRFCKSNSHWLNDFADYTAIKLHQNNNAWQNWENDRLRMHHADSIKEFELQHKEEIDFYKFLQYEFFIQWKSLREYANSNGVRIIGDIPIYVSADSSDVWSNSSEFRLDQNHKPKSVAGVPPDYFSPTGQLWGNPLYDWDKMKENGYKWWIDRIRKSLELFDTIRIDHFRGLESYWAVPAGDTTAQNGTWIKGPGISLFNAIREKIGTVDIIAEDLGTITDEVRALLRDSGYPGMKVLQFAFSRGYESDYLPFHHVPNCVCYTGTHDNDTLIGWLGTVSDYDRQYIFRFTRTDNIKECAEAIIDIAWASEANLTIVPMQDLLGLGSEGRMNTPSYPDGNWCWKMNGGYPESLIESIKERNETYFR